MFEIGQVLEIEWYPNNSERKDFMIKRKAKIIQITKDLIVMRFPALRGNKSFIESFRKIDLENRIVKYKVLQ